MSDTSIEKKLLKYKSGLYSFALSLTNNMDDADDLLQDTILKILSNKDNYIEKGAFNSWACTLMHNIFVNNYRKESSKNLLIQDSFPLYIKSNEIQSDSTFSNSEVLSILNKLPVNLLKVFKLYLNGFSYKEISDRLCIPLGTVKTRIYASRIRLKKVFKLYNK